MDLAKFHYTRLGSGAPVLLVNGVFQRRQAWDPIAYFLASQFDVILFDFPNQNMDLNGNGADSSFDRPDLYEDYILDFLGALSLNPKDVMACGLSFGSNLLRNMHLSRGVDFKKLVLIGAYCPALLGFYKQFNRAFSNALETYGVECFASFITFWFFSQKWLSENPLAHEFLTSRYKVMFPDESGIRALCKAAVAEQERGIPDGRMRCEAVIVNGVDDAISPPRYMEPYAASVGASFCSVDGGHAFTAESPEMAAALLLEILARDNPAFDGRDPAIATN
jgi:pimeloyl-ACP methyl ester carboxylesterase